MKGSLGDNCYDKLLRISTNELFGLICSLLLKFRTNLTTWMFPTVTGVRMTKLLTLSLRL